MEVARIPELHRLGVIHGSAISECTVGFPSAAYVQAQFQHYEMYYDVY